MRVLKNLKPAKVFQFFEELCAIPHGSGNTKKISDYCVEFAKKQGLPVYQDGLNNVIIKKHATIGLEDRPTVILQGHLDMVCEKSADCDIDFERDGLRLCTEGDFVFAQGTSLGGDDGIAVAMALAVLSDDNLPHPPLEAVFTVDEETGMYGAEGLDTEKLDGKILLNIDSEEMGTLIVSCAGGTRADICLKLGKSVACDPCYTVSIDGLAGGHSGTEINKGRLNAIKLMGGLLGAFGDNLKIADIKGGNKDNVIPGECRCTLSTTADITNIAKEFARNCSLGSDTGLKVTVTPCDGADCFDEASSEAAIKLLNDLPCGVVKMSDDIEGLVQTSLNAGTVEIKDGTLRITYSVRSSVNSEKEQLLSSLKEIAFKYGGDFSRFGDYPAWEYKKDSRLRNIMVSVYEELFGDSPKVEALHAGLECGIFAKKIPNIDAVSFGPDILDIHSVKERLSISSTARTYNYICQILSKI